jgi:hydroxyacylglutathione hydrolase
VIVQRVEAAGWLSNAYLIVDEPGGRGVLVDSNAVTDPLAERAEREGTEITHLVLTHHHQDHVAGARKLADRFGVPIVAHELANELVDEGVDETIGDGDVIESGRLRIDAIHTPGHCADHLALLINGSECLTADVLFKGTVGGTRTPGATGFEDLRSSVMDRLMKLEHDTRIHPGHRQPSTIGAEWAHNPFIRVWRGLDPESSAPCTIGTADAVEREPATLVLWAADYDGGNKAWVRFPDGEDAIVGSSQVKLEGLGARHSSGFVA